MSYPTQGLTQLCTICNEIHKLYTKYPQSICKSCCTDIPVSMILEIMDPSYHEAIGSTSKVTLPLKHLPPTSYPVFWCTTNNSDKFQRCGVTPDIKSMMETFTHLPSETRMVIVESYWKEESGIRDMKKLKQNFKRIRAGKRYYRY